MYAFFVVGDQHQRVKLNNGYSHYCYQASISKIDQYYRNQKTTPRFVFTMPENL